MATNASSLVNFGTTGPAVGEFIYAIGPRSAPSFLPADSSTTSYLNSSYPALAALINTPATTFSATYPTISPNTGWIKIAYGNSVFVVTSQGPNTNAAYSSDGTTWSNSSTANGNWYGLAFGAGTFVTVSQGLGGTGTTNAATTTNGVTWTTRTLPSTQMWNAVAFGNSTFVAISNAPSNVAGTAAATSADGITWTARTLPSSAMWYAITYGNGVFVALSKGSAAATSPDGITWTARTFPVSSGFPAIAFGNGVFVAQSGNWLSNLIYTSTDGITWTPRPQANPVNPYPIDLSFGNGIFVATGSYGTLYTSLDGVNWINWPTASTSSNFTNAAYGGGVFCAIGGGSAIRATIATTATAFQIPVISPITGTTAYVKAT